MNYPMLKFTIKPTHIRFDLVKKSPSYNPIQNLNVIRNIIDNAPQYLTNAIGLTKSLCEKKNVTSQIIDQYVKDNPVGLFSECVGEFCPLNRLVTPSLRHNYETLAFAKNLARITNNHPTYTSFGPGYYFQDIINLCIMIRHGFEAFNINFIEDTLDYVECISNPNKNKLADQHLITYEINDDHTQRQMWCRFKTYRIIKLLELFSEHTDHLTLFKSPENYIKLCSIDSSCKSEIICGIDYMDDFTYNSNVLFNLMSVYCTTPNGLIFNFYRPSLSLVIAEVYQKIKEFDEIPSMISERKYNVENLVKDQRQLIHVKINTDKPTYTRKRIHLLQSVIVFGCICLTNYLTK